MFFVELKNLNTLTDSLNY